MDLFLNDESWNSFQFQDAVIGLMNLSLIQTVSIISDNVHFSLHLLIKVSQVLFIDHLHSKALSTYINFT